MSSSDRVDLAVQIGALRLPNPILAASGTFGYGLEFAHLVDFKRIGGFVTKGISMEAIEGAPAPRLCETPSGMLNAVGLQNVGVEAFVTGKLPLLRKYNTTVVVNVFGYCIEEYVSVIQRLEEADGIAAYELNISCPNVKKGGMQFGSNPALVEEVVRAAKAVAVKTAALGEVDATCYRHWTYCEIGGSCRRRCPYCREHLSGHVGGCPNRKVQIRESNRRLVGPGHSSNDGSAGLGS